MRGAQPDRNDLAMMPVMKRLDERLDTQALLQTCHERSIELLKQNLTAGGILAAAPGDRAQLRGYTAIFGRDAAVCAIGMAVSGDKQLEREAVTGLHTLADHQAPNGQIPKFVDLHQHATSGRSHEGRLGPTRSRRMPAQAGTSHAMSGWSHEGRTGPTRSRRMPAPAEADFWYLGCIDSTLWWLIALAILDRRGQPRGLLRRHSRRIKLAIQWLLAQEHQRFFLLQQNEASDWADIMPRSGFVLYTNALWYFVKLLFAIPHAEQTYENFNGLFHPFSARLAEYRRARLLNEYVLQKGRDRDLYLSFVNFSFWGDEGDVFGNVLAVLMGLADARATRRTLDALTKARVGDPYPVRAVTHPIRHKSSLWRPYMARHRQNQVWQYHNGGIWPMVGGFWVAALAAAGRSGPAQRGLIGLARACEVGDWAFTEWLHGRTLVPRGMPGQSWNAAAFLLAQYAVAGGTDLFAA
jgi:glycogen debranching enzyme